MRVKKRSGKTQNFNVDKIKVAILKAADSIEQEIPNYMLNRIASKVEEEITNREKKTISSSEISEIVEDALMNSKYKDIARAYIENRYKADLIHQVNTTDDSILDLLRGENDYWNRENSNKNSKETTTLRDYIAGITSTDIARRVLLPKHLVKAHDDCILHIHDMDYIATPRNNCCLCNLRDMLDNGTVVHNIKIEQPKRFITAMTIATQLITAVSSSQYGGISVTMAHLAPYVRKSYDRYLDKYKDWGFSDSQAEKFAEEDTRREVKDGVQTFNYQVNSMSTTNGQAPFITVSLDISETDEYKSELSMIIEEFLEQRIEGMKNEQGVYITVAFPKLIYVLSEENITEDSPYWYLTELAAKCTAKRMVPDYVSKKKMLEYKINRFGNGDCYPPMGCRSFLTPYRTHGNISKALDYVEGEPRYWGRFNNGVVTINLPDIAFSSKGDFDKFWELFEERTELCHEALKFRLQMVAGNSPDVAPILWKHGAFARLDSEDSIEPLLHDGYSTISLGYMGLYECVKFMTGHSHTDEGVGEEFGLKVMQALNDKCAQWKKAEDVDYSVYGTPIESLTYKAARSLKRRFGEDVFEKLDGVDRDYVTNSYHVWVEEEIDPFEKIYKEAKFQKLSPGGAITYIETANLTNNIEAVIEVIKFIYDNIVYAELNTKSDYCAECGYEGEIEITEVGNGELGYKCPHCGNTNPDKMHVCRRVCGYLSTTMPNQGRLDEIAHRYIHLDNKECCC